MALLNNQTYYFAPAEFKEILKHYGKVIKDDNFSYKEKLSYDVYMRLFKAPKGIIVFEDSSNVLWYYDATLQEAEPLYATNRNGVKIAQYYHDKTSLIAATTDECDFHRFFVEYYLTKRVDYIPQDKKEDKETVTLNNCTISNFENLDDTWSIEFTSSDNAPLYNLTTDASATFTIDGVNVSEALKELAGAAQTTAGAFADVGKEIKKLQDKNEEKENKNMKGINFDFGPCTNDNVRMSMYGIAVKNLNGEWVSYNPSTTEIINVDIFNFDGRKYMFKMPVPIADIMVGDVVIHQKKPMFVTEVCGDESGLIVIDVHSGEEKKILLTKSPFGFNFATKVVSMFSAFAAAPTPDSPFGNFLPFMLMGDDNDTNIDPMMLMMMMGQNGNAGDLFNNPMMMYLMFNKNGNNDSMLPLMLMMNQPQTTKGKNGK